MIILGATADAEAQISFEASISDSTINAESQINLAGNVEGFALTNDDCLTVMYEQPYDEAKSIYESMYEGMDFYEPFPGDEFEIQQIEPDLTSVNLQATIEK